MNTAASDTGPARATTTTLDPRSVSAARRLLIGVVTGLLAGVGMYVVLAAVAVAQGRSATYPFAAVQALMSGARVLPDSATLYGARATDVILGPVYFFVPAIAAGVFIASRVARRSARGEPPRSLVAAAAVPAFAVTAAFFLLFIVVLGFREAAPNVQRISSGAGVRALGVGAWIAAHVVYAVLVTVLLAPVTEAANRVTAASPRR